MKALTIFKAVTKNWMRSRSGVFFSILFPVLLLLVLSSIFSGGGGASKYSLFVQNLDVSPTDGKPTELSTAFVNTLNRTGTFSLTEVPANENATKYAREVLGPLGGNIRILIISEGFQDELLNSTLKVRIGIIYGTLQYFEPYLTDAQKAEIAQGLSQMQQLNTTLPDTKVYLTIMLDPADQSALIVKNVIMSITSAFNYELIGAENVIEFNEVAVITTRFKNVDFYVPGITAAFIMTNGIIALTATTTEFKRRGIIKRLSITPLSKMDWVIGNILSQTLLNLMLAAIMIVLGWIIFDVHVALDALSISLILLGSILFSGIGMTLAGFIKDVEAASAIGNAIAFPMMFLSGTYFPMEIMPPYLQMISKAIPLTYFSEGLKHAMIYQNPEGVYLNMAIIGVLAVIFIILGSFVTRWKEK
ncbi:MAG: ABC transporter permease [Candidatus Bathyarchaeia archaeon]